MKYTQEQVLEHTSKYGLKVYAAYVKEALDYYNSFMGNYIASVGYMMLWGKTPEETVSEEAHKFSLAATSLIYPKILCEQIDIYYQERKTTNSNQP